MDREEQEIRTGMGRRAFIGLGAVAGATVFAGLHGAPVGAATLPGISAETLARAARVRAGFVMTGQALGVNTTSGDAQFADAVVPRLLRDAGIGRIRYPGGGGADSSDWRSTTVPLPWPEFMDLLAEIGAAPMNTVNYGQLSQGPSAAAAWVASAGTFSNYSSKTAVWVLGNEGYGPWERDEHPDPHTPLSYATNVRPYFTAMHAIDPKTRVGFPMTIDRQVAGGTGTWVPDPTLWNTTVLGHNADQVDFIDFHWYPIFGIPLLSNAELFDTVDRIPGAVSYLRGIIDRYNPKLPILNSESNISQSEIVYNTQPVSALFAAATSLKFLSQGVESSMWWQVHNADNMNGDFGFLSSGTGTPGPSETTLAAAVLAGARNVDVASSAGFYYAHRFTIDAGAVQESRKITALPGSTVLASAAVIGDRNVKVAETSTITVDGATSDYHQLFATGTPVTIGTGATQDTLTVVNAGTAASTASLAAPAAAGDSTIRIVGVGMGGQSIPVFMPTGFAVGSSVTVGTGTHAEHATVARIGTSSSLGTTTVTDTSAGASTIYVVDVTDTNTGLATYVGDPITIGTGSTVETRTITAVGTGAADATTTVAPIARGARKITLASTVGVTPGHPLLIGTGTSAQLVFAVTAVGSAVTLSSPIRSAYPQGTAVRDVGTGISLSSPLSHAHAAGSPARDAGSGLVLRAPLRRAHADGAVVTTGGSGLTLSGPILHRHPAGDAITSSGITFTPALDRAHPAGAPLNELGLKEPPVDTPLPAYYGYLLTSKMTTPGARLTEVASPKSTVLAYLSHLGTTSTIMLINTDDTASVTARVNGLPKNGTAHTYGYGLENPSVVEGTINVATVKTGVTLPPESITMMAVTTGIHAPSVSLTIR